MKIHMALKRCFCALRMVLVFLGFVGLLKSYCESFVRSLNAHVLIPKLGMNAVLFHRGTECCAILSLTVLRVFCLGFNSCTNFDSLSTPRARTRTLRNPRHGVVDTVPVYNMSPSPLMHNSYIDASGPSGCAWGRHRQYCFTHMNLSLFNFPSFVF